jgi:uncharacterized membrane protein (Fun14 family)
MKKITKTTALFVGIFLSSSIFAMQGLSVITITTDEPEDYVEWLTKKFTSIPRCCRQ